MHLGEKGFWNKWSLFDESTRVPLLVVDPDTPAPIRGTHYPHPVELLDIFPTLLDMFPYLIRCPPAHVPIRSCVRAQGEPLTIFLDRCPPGVAVQVKCPRPQGKSLAAVLYDYRQPTGVNIPFLSALFWKPKLQLRTLNMTFAISQVLKCAKRADIEKYTSLVSQVRSLPREKTLNLNVTNPWRHCFTSRAMISRDELLADQEVSLMGYSFRLRGSQYIIWLHYDRLTCKLSLDEPPYAEEYYKASRGNSGEVRGVNVFGHVDKELTTRLRKFAVAFLKKKRFFRFRNCFS